LRLFPWWKNWFEPQDTSTAIFETWLLTFLQSRLAVNSVTLGDYERPLQISNFIKDLFSGFQLLNLKNDILRKRSDGVKYSVSLPFPLESIIRWRGTPAWL